MPTEIELLAPARDADIAIDAINHGADAVYMGGPSHGARSAAINAVSDIARAVEAARQFDVRIYVTLNTLAYDNELRRVEHLVNELYRAGVDALIVQDMSLLRLDIPPIALHASTQCDIRTPAKARFLADAGFTRLVLPRELTLDEISAVHSTVPDVDLEAFIHGALCVCYSGDCQASFVTTGRSANRGECAQVCRLPYDLVDASGRVIVRKKHLLSLRDMNRADEIASMLDAGVMSLKIEGRLKDALYVRNTVAAYNRILDDIVAANPAKYMRSSSGRSVAGFTPDLSKGFNRGFTSYFLHGQRPSSPMSSPDTPKMRGERVGKVISVNNGKIKADITHPLNNGDGLTFFNRDGMLVGFRLNRVEGNILFPATQRDSEHGGAAMAAPYMSPGTVLYRNRDKAHDDTVERAVTRRTIDIDMALRPIDNERVALDITDDRGNAVTTVIDAEISPAQRPQRQERLKTLSKLGATVYTLRNLDDRLGDRFIPASLLTSLRRKGTELLDSARRARLTREKRGVEKKDSIYPTDTLTYHDNIANHLAERFYRDHGVTDIQPAIETSRNTGAETVVMTTRYCLRRESGRCLLTSAGRQWPTPLFLVSGRKRFRLDFNCKECRMRLIANTDNQS